MTTDDFQADHEYLTNQRRRNLPVGESGQDHQENRQRGSRSIQETVCLWMEPEKALTANVMTDEYWKARASLAGTKQF